MLIFGVDRELTRWAGDRLGIKSFGACATIGVVRRGKIVAVAVYNHFSPPDIHVSFASSTPLWASREVIGAILRYPFVQLRCKRVTAITEEQNQGARKFLQRLGFIEEGRHPDAFDADAGISYGLLRNDAMRWIAGSEKWNEKPHA